MNSDKKTMVIFMVAILLFAGLLGVVFLTKPFDDIIDTDDDEPDETVLRREVIEYLKDYKMPKRLKHRDLIFKKENFTLLSDFQKYVTPYHDTIQTYIDINQLNSLEDAYNIALSWVWVSDQLLHGEPEKWLYPSQFITNTPTDTDNPVSGSMASDCESQAYTLVSLIEGMGFSSYDIRVCVGEVDFGEGTGGHAWVQIYQNGEWFELEPTSGPYWDEDENILEENNGVPFSYFKNNPYPVVEYWAFFNDKLYYNPLYGAESENLPTYWHKT